LLYTTDGNGDTGNWETLESVQGETKTLLYKNMIENRTTEKEQLFISVDDSQLVVNNPRDIRDEDYFYDEIYGSEFNTSFRCSSEASSVWKWNGLRWEKKSPYYASLEQIHGGFIASSGYVEENTLDYSTVESVGFPSSIHTEIPTRYFWLDENLEARFYGDWVDFDKVENLGFGVAIWIRGQAAFVDYSGKAITDAEWHRFELENGKLKAIRDEIILFDSEGYEMLDENGDVMKSSEGAIKYFDFE